jgi:uncharacterized membrane protein SpoIIM required for sporulation
VTLTQDEFVATRKAEWEELSRLLAQRTLHRLPPSTISRAAALYRALCTDLMRARAAGYAGDLITHLDDLAGRAHNALYAAPPHRWSSVTGLVLRDFPRAVRKQSRMVALSAALFLLPGLVGFFGAASSRGFAASVLDEHTMTEMQKMYQHEPNQREADEATFMAGFYVQNNVSVAFRVFAVGILFGLGSVFFLIYQGLILGTIMGCVAHAGYGHNIFTFCCGHSSFELTAIVIAGAAGLQMGYSLVDTRGRTRWGSLRSQTREIAHLVLGAALMLCVAALIEGFWSPSAAPAVVKWVMAGVLAILVTLYFVFVGRRGEARA